jgi:hypothetical protein
MTLFFLVVGLEARREFDLGDLRERRFTLPLAAELTGMAIPVLTYLAINAGHGTTRGWGVAMSTDTALSLGLLAGPSTSLLYLAAVPERPIGPIPDSRILCLSPAARDNKLDRPPGTNRLDSLPPHRSAEGERGRACPLVEELVEVCGAGEAEPRCDLRRWLVAVREETFGLEQHSAVDVLLPTDARSIHARPGQRAR